MQNNFIESKDNGILVKIKLIPNAKKNEISCNEDEIRVRITAQPIENKANKMLIEYLSKKIKIAKTKISIIKGQTSRDKLLFIDEISIEAFKDKINN